MLSRHSCNTRNLHIFIDAFFSFALQRICEYSGAALLLEASSCDEIASLCAANSGEDDDSEEKPFSGCTGWKR